MPLSGDERLPPSAAGSLRLCPLGTPAGQGQHRVAAREAGLQALGSADPRMDASLFTLGAGAPDAALLLNRVALGLFFSISGYHKLFNAARHATLTRTLQDDGVRPLPVMEWLIPTVEFSGGCALLLGFLSALAAFGLGVICLGAVALDAIKRIA